MTTDDPTPSTPGPAPGTTAASRLALLTEATALLGASSDVEVSLGRLAHLLVPNLADVCSVTVVEPGGSLRRVAVAAADPDKQVVARELEEALPADPAATTGVAEVVRTGRSRLYEQVDDGLLRSTAHDERYYDLTARLGVQSCVIVPLRARGRTIGALSLLAAESGRRYTDEDLDFAEGLARWAALTLDNARLLHEARRASDRFRELVDNLEAVVFEADPEPLRFTFVSSRAEELFGYPVSRWTDEPESFLEIVEPDDREHVHASWRHAVAAGGQHTFEYRVRTADGRLLWLQDRVEVVPARHDEPARVLGLVVDVTEEKTAAARLVAQHATSRVLTEADSAEAAMPAVIEAVCTSLDWRVGGLWEIDDATQRLACTVTWQAQGVDAAAFWDMTAQLAFARGQGLPGSAWQKEDCVWISDVTRHPDYPRTDVAERAGLHSGLACPVISGGRVLGVMEFYSDRILEPDDDLLDMLGSIGRQVGQFLERRRAQQAAAFQAALLKAQSDTGVEGQLVVSPDGRMLAFNRRFVELWDVPAEILDARDDAAFLEMACQRVRDPEGFLERIRFLYAHPAERARDEVVLGDGRILDRYGAPLVGDDGTYYGWAWYFRDVTAQRRAERDLRESRARFASLARTLQASLLPPRTPTIPGAEVAARYRAAGEGVDVGGDFYDVFPVREDHWGLVIGDVCGKGAQAAALTALTRYTVRAAAARGRRPSRVLRELNDAILREDDLGERFCTVVYADMRLDGEGAAVTVASGGHPLPLVLRRDGQVEAVGRTGTIVGAFAEPELEDADVTLAAGDAVVLFTDGVLEARSGSDLFGHERLARTLEAAGRTSATAIADAVIDAVVAFGGEPRDDVAIVVVRLPGS